MSDPLIGDSAHPPRLGEHDHEDRQLRQIVVGVRQVLDDMPQAAYTATASTRRDHLIERTALDLRARVLAEELPPQHLTTRSTADHVFDLNVQQGDPRWASWWDHLKATYAHRWWARPLVRRFPARTIDTVVTIRDRQTRTCEHHIDVTVRQRWVYPHAPYVISPDLGAAVFKSDTGYRASARTLGGDR